MARLQFPYLDGLTRICCRTPLPPLLPAIQYQANYPQGIAVDAAGNIFFSDYSQRVRVVSPDGAVKTVAGTGIAGYFGESQAAVGANLDHPLGIAVDSNGVLYIADRDNYRIRRVSNGIIATVAGDGNESCSCAASPR